MGKTALSFKTKGNFKKTERYLEKTQKLFSRIDFDHYANLGVSALQRATPIDSGKTADSWSYRIARTDHSVTISFLNSNVKQGIPVAILIQYGHATISGGWVEGVDYINPAIEPIVEDITNKLKKGVTS